MNRKSRVRRAYEVGALKRALPWAIPPALLALIAAWSGSHSAWLAGPALGVVVVAMRWRGGDLGRAAIAGLVAGTVPYAVMMGSTCSGVCSPVHCAAMGTMAGVLGAVALARALPTRATMPVAGALGVAALTASMVCLTLGIPGLLVLPVLVAAAPPVLVLRRS